MTHTPLFAGKALLGRIINSQGEPIDEKGPIAESADQINQLVTLRTADRQGIYETGIKAIDLLAPIPRGGVIGIYGGMGVGKLALLEEMIFTFAQRSHGYTVCLSTYEQSYATTPFIEMVQESQIQEQMILIFEPAQEQATTRYTQLLQAGLTVAEQMCTQGHKILLVIDASLANQSETIHIDELRQFAREKDVLIIVLRGMTEDATQEPDHFDSTIVLSDQLAKLSLWPAIDRQQTSSILFESDLMSDEHKQVVHGVKQILRRHNELQGYTTTHFMPEDQQIVRRAQCINFFLTQPFTIAEQFTGKPGEYLTVNQTVADFRAIITGQYDDVPPQAFHFIGQAEQARTKK